MSTPIHRGFQPQVSRRRMRSIVLFLLTLGVSMISSWDLVQADVVIFKDGFTVEGKVKRESTVLVEGSVIMSVPKQNSFFLVDDGARRIFFPYRQVQNVEAKDVNRGQPDLRFDRPLVRVDARRLPAGQYLDFGPWNAKWDRVIHIKTQRQRKPEAIDQHVSTLTPHYALIAARWYNWDSYYLLNELDPASIRALLPSHPSMKKDGGKGDLEKRFTVFRFLIEAGFFDQAAAELDSIQKDFPEDKERVDAKREALRKLLLAQLMDLIEEAQKVGRHGWAQARLANFPVQGLDESLLARLRTLQSAYESIEKNLSLARRFLEELPPAIGDSSLRDTLGEAAAVIVAELNPDTVNRLESFLAQAQQAERERAQNRSPANSPEQLLAMAVSGWFLGSVSAENKVDTALRLWRARQFILAYERTMDYQTRRRNLTTFVKNGGVAFDEVDRLLKAIPPAEPFDLSGGNSSALALAGLPFVDNTVALAALTAQRLLSNGAYELQASLPWSFRKGANYLVQLPPEYHPGRHYPVLFVLHEAGERPEDMLKRWSFLAAQHGYFLVAPEWENHDSPGYHFSHDEQRAVLDVLRHLRQHFQVDSDRVFLTGLGEGGTMAFDVGLAHPDCFAGVMPMGGRPRYFAKAYWQNGQYLPFYVIDGDLDGEAAKDLRRQFEQWIPKGYPSLYVQYKGRGSEWFGGEVPYLFDWMGRKKRAAAFPELGRAGLGSFGEEFQSMRPMDNHFYWLEGQELKDRHVNDGRSWSNKVTAAKLQARIKDNDIFVNTQGFRLVTVWLGQGMIDFEKPVKMTLNAKVNFGVRKIAPNLETLLEDFYQRADRQRPFLAKVELPVP